MRVLASVLLLSASLGLSACGSDDSSDPTSPAIASTPAAAATTPVASTPASTPSKSTTTAVTQGTCSEVSAPAARPADVAKPTGSLSTSKKNLVTMKTSCGTIVIELDPKTHPVTANAVAWMADHKYYDDVSFHRVVPNFVIQGGDPTGTGSGDPSWKLAEAPGKSAKYPVGTMAMAKTSDAPDGTIGGQFFIMTGGELPPQYAIAGKVISGMDAVKAIEALGSGDGPPSRPAVIIKATFQAK